LNPSALDAGALIDEIDRFDPQLSTMSYFEEYYQARIKTMHPSSRFGIFPVAPLEADDFVFLRSGLIESLSLADHQAGNSNRRVGRMHSSPLKRPRRAPQPRRTPFRFGNASSAPPSTWALRAWSRSAETALIGAAARRIG
jgi:hypothetical protein